MIVLDQIKKLRKEKKISQKKMAELLNISQPGYQKIENGTNVLSIERFLDISRILEITSYNQLLPAVNIEFVEEIENVLMSGYLAFKNIHSNGNYIRKSLSEIIGKIETGKIEKSWQIEELQFLDNYLAIIGKESFTNQHKYILIREMLEKID